MQPCGSRGHAVASRRPGHYCPGRVRLDRRGGLVLRDASMRPGHYCPGRGIIPILAVSPFNRLQ